jgi:Questin oxidase-like
MHLVTSSLFLSSLSAHLKPSSQELLLRSYLAVSLSWYIDHGCPKFNIPGFFAADIAYPTPPGPLPTPDKEALLGQTSPKAVTPNPWLPIIQTTLVHPDDHLSKLQRALAHYGSLYGTRPAGLPDFTDTELPGADKLDGTLFIRIAGLTAKRMGRVRDGEKPLDF